MNINTVKQTNKKTTNPPAQRRAAELSSPPTPLLKNAPGNSAVDGKKVLASKPVGSASPPPTAAKAATIETKLKDAGTPTPQPFALLSEKSTARAAKAVAADDKRAFGQKPGAPASRATTIEAKIDVGYGNTLYLRGQGPGLSWERGVPCECVDRNTWRWTAPRAEKLTFKLLLNDSVWARGADLVIGPGEKLEIVPSF
jgi:hypothetical protein